MRISGFNWDEWNIHHIAQHNVTPQEVEEASFNQSICRKTKGGLYLIYGQSDAGRYLFTVIRLQHQQIAYVITSRNMTAAEQNYYRKER